MPKALMTGATGFIGGALLRELLARGWEVRAITRPTSNPRNLEGLERSFECVPADLRDRRSLCRAMEGCDTVFHVAARYSLWNPDSRQIYLDNVEGTRNVLETAQELRVRKVVYTSTVGVLRSPRDGGPADESCLASAQEVHGHYKRSKWLAEACARDHAARGLPVVIVNPSTPVGPFDVKPTPTGRMVLDFLNGRMPGYTNSGLNLVAVEDVAVGHILAAERGVPGERYILGCENVSLRDILEVLSRLTGRPPPRWRVPRKLLLPLSVVSAGIAIISRREPLIPWEAAWMAQRHMYFDSSRARRELGYAPGDVRQALERSVRWFESNGYTSGKPMGSRVLEPAATHGDAARAP
ncbi:MAG TPA: hopanoid-associated sugar epimerase [Planctomycetota bacterium]|nr:hopanoid-associated sugar epimerase [Planctomycetota bacterium]